MWPRGTVWRPIEWGIQWVWAVRGSNRGGGRDFPQPSRPALESTYLSIQWVPGLYRGLRSRVVALTTPLLSSLGNNVPTFRKTLLTSFLPWIQRGKRTHLKCYYLSAKLYDGMAQNIVISSLKSWYRINKTLNFQGRFSIEPTVWPCPLEE